MYVHLPFVSLSFYIISLLYPLAGIPVPKLLLFFITACAQDFLESSNPMISFLFSYINVSSASLVVFKAYIIVE